MSRGLGKEQQAIMRAIATKPVEWWSRTELQQAAWGKRRLDYGLKVPEGEGTHRWVKNVRWWRDHSQLTEGNFTRALLSLERRGLIIGRRAPGCHPSWRLRLSDQEEAAL